MLSSRSENKLRKGYDQSSDVVGIQVRDPILWGIHYTDMVLKFALRFGPRFNTTMVSLLGVKRGGGGGHGP